MKADVIQEIKKRLMATSGVFLNIDNFTLRLKR